VGRSHRASGCFVRASIAGSSQRLEESVSTPVPGVEDEVRILAYESDRVEVAAAFKDAGFPLLLDTYGPGWQACVFR